MNNPAVMKAEGVSRFFKDGTQRLDVLKNVSLEIRAGEVTALVGKSGSGKSTLLHLLGLLDQPDLGGVTFEGHEVGRMPETSRAALRNSCIGFVFQHFFLLPDFNVLENVLMPAKIMHSALQWPSRKAACEARAIELLASVGLGERLNHFPRTLSGGERQRVALARALYMEPKVLLCDEPTGNLDPESGAQVMDLIFDAAQKNAAVMVVTHDMGLAQRANRLLTLEAGVLKQ